MRSSGTSNTCSVVGAVAAAVLRLVILFVMVNVILVAAGGEREVAKPSHVAVAAVNEAQN